MRADAHELVHARHAADDRLVADVHVARQLRVARQMMLLPSWQSCADVHVGHDPVVVADARDARVLHRAGVDRA